MGYALTYPSYLGGLGHGLGPGALWAVKLRV